MALQVIIASTIFSLTITEKRCKHQPHAVKVWRMATQSQFLLTECIHTIKNPRYLAFLPLRAQSNERMLILCELSFFTNFFLPLPFFCPIVSVGRFYFFLLLSLAAILTFFFIICLRNWPQKSLLMSHHNSVQLLALFIISSLIMILKIEKIKSSDDYRLTYFELLFCCCLNSFGVMSLLIIII